MPPNSAHLATHLFAPGSTLNQRLQQLHERLLDAIPCVDRIACAIYDPKEDWLKTFINSTREGRALNAYQFKLADSETLSELARLEQPRVIDDIPAALKPDNVHSRWVLEQGYHSSFTVPIYDNGVFAGFVFFDSRQSGAFTPVVQRDLALYCNLINMTLASEFAAVRSILATVAVARDFANLRDFETGAHLERMARIARVIARAIAGKYGLSDEFVEHVYLFAPLHDIGKIGVADHILLKPGRLDPQERALIQSHVSKGVEIIDKILGDFGLQQMPDSTILKNIVLLHHEFLDGSGYPASRRGAEIPIEARIVTVADIFDALTSQRPYKKSWSFEDACAELERMVTAGKLDADCVATLRTHQEELAGIIQRYQDAEAA
ncbi:MAG: HD domain-containing protein [Hylemonella sp.]|jgi:HD-GYP domain-containing protein (c-di-GMP phosphodiesterase class II)|nr:HD domain-containing protein [Hylemonella sp.]